MIGNRQQPHSWC